MTWFRSTAQPSQIPPARSSPPTRFRPATWPNARVIARASPAWRSAVRDAPSASGAERKKTSAKGGSAPAATPAADEQVGRGEQPPARCGPRRSGRAARRACACCASRRPRAAGSGAGRGSPSRGARRCTRRTRPSRQAAGLHVVRAEPGERAEQQEGHRLARAVVRDAERRRGVEPAEQEARRAEREHDVARVERVQREPARRAPREAAGREREHAAAASSPLWITRLPSGNGLFSNSRSASRPLGVVEVVVREVHAGLERDEAEQRERRSASRAPGGPGARRAR